MRALRWCRRLLARVVLAWHGLDEAGRWHDPTHGRIDRDIQEAVEAAGYTGAQRVAVENTLQRRRDHERST